MKNTQGVWILYGVVLSLNFLNANEWRTAAEKHGIAAETAGANQPRHFRHSLSLKWWPENVLCWGRGDPFVSTWTERL